MNGPVLLDGSFLDVGVGVEVDAAGIACGSSSCWPCLRVPDAAKNIWDRPVNGTSATVFRAGDLPSQDTSNSTPFPACLRTT